MKYLDFDVAVIGAGPAGVAAAIAAKKDGAEKVVIIERDKKLGGILQQCIHPGFGLKYFNEELTGPEYMDRFIDEALELNIELFLESMVLSISEDKEILCTNRKEGMIKIKASSIVLAMGCRERTRGAIAIPGTRPAGVYTAGSAQRLINMQGCMVGKEVVILGSGDIGMIMARRMTFEGAKVKAVIEILPYVSGLIRNKVQCLDDFGIPLYLNHTVTNVCGNKRLEKVTVAKLGEDGRPDSKTEFDITCDTLLLSVGLIPENELSKSIDVNIDPVTQGPVVNENMETSVPGVFASGNVVHVNDLVDNVTIESQIAGRAAAVHALSKEKEEQIKAVSVIAGDNVRYIMPHKISDINNLKDDLTVYFRVQQPADKVKISVKGDDNVLYEKKTIKVRPGEMEAVCLKKKDLVNVTNNICIDVI
jgi:NADPH-dependent 2,4-dienoyl-CoA reductase/sulfur reductase-like enzyme